MSNTSSHEYGDAFGTKESWRGAYSLHYDSSQELNESSAQLHKVVEHLKNLDQAMSDTAKDLRNPLFAARGAQEAADAITEETQRLLEALQRSGDTVTAAINYTERVYESVSDKERQLGDALKAQPLPGYVERAIGTMHPAISKRWTQVRGGIMAFRYATDETRTGVTLGRGNDEPWSNLVLRDKVYTIDKIQVAQLLLPENNAKETAEKFGKAYLIEELGLPPVLSDRGVTRIIEIQPKDQWYGRALGLCAIVANQGDGLLPLDRPYL